MNNGPGQIYPKATGSDLWDFGGYPERKGDGLLFEGFLWAALAKQDEPLVNIM